MVADSFDVIFYTAIFILPGFMMANIIDAANPTTSKSEGVSALRYLGYSIIQCACCSWLYKWVLPSKELHPVRFWLLWLAITLVGGTLLGIICAAIKQNNVAKSLLKKIHIRSLHPTPTAWDYIFSQEKSGYLIVTLTDNTKVYGWYSTNSFTASKDGEHDIYIEKQYSCSADGEWMCISDSAGIYIPANQVKYIEFKGEDSGGNKR